MAQDRPKVNAEVREVDRIFARRLRRVYGSSPRLRLGSAIVHDAYDPWVRGVRSSATDRSRKVDREGTSLGG
jgi:hypothetical protein